jgi:glycosyltransferase involved in cell wall biosynthesis
MAITQRHDRIHIARVAGQFPPAPGGLAPGMLALSLEQHRRGSHITVITMDAEGADAVDSQLPFRVIRVPTKSLTCLGWRASALLRDLREQPDVVHCHEPAAVPLLLRKRTGDPPIVITLHTVRRYQYGLYRDLGSVTDSFARITGAPVRNPPRSYHPLSSWVARTFLLERYMCRRAEHLALVAGYFAQQVEDYYGVQPERYTVTYNGSAFQESSSRDAERTKIALGFDEGDRVILYVGRLDWVKRAHLLVQAMPAILEHEKRARLLLVGDGDQREDLQVLVDKMGLEDYVTKLGWIRHDRLREIYGFVECLCLPSIWEGLSKVLLEAMSVQVPVLASDIPANRELFQGGRYGYLVEEPSPACWASAVSHHLRVPGEGEARAHQAVKLVDERYRWGHVAERLDGVYETVVSRS